MKLVRYGMIVLIGFMAVSCAEEGVNPLRGTGPGSGGSGGDDDDDDPIVVPPPKPKSNADSSSVYIVVNGY